MIYSAIILHSVLVNSLKRWFLFRPSEQISPDGRPKLRFLAGKLIDQNRIKTRQETYTFVIYIYIIHQLHHMSRTYIYIYMFIYLFSLLLRVIIVKSSSFIVTIVRTISGLDPTHETYRRSPRDFAVVPWGTKSINGTSSLFSQNS